MGSINFSRFWQIYHLATDPRPEYQDMKEKLVRWGHKIAETEALWLVAACHENQREFYEELGFRYRGTYTSRVPRNIRELNVAWLQKGPDPIPPADL